MLRNQHQESAGNQQRFNNGLTDVQQRLLDGVRNMYYCPKCGTTGDGILITAGHEPILVGGLVRTPKNDGRKAICDCGFTGKPDSFWHDSPFGTLGVKDEVVA